MDPLESHLLAQTSGRQVDFWHEVRSLTVTTRLPTPDATVVDIGAGAGALGDILGRDHPGVRYAFLEPIDSLAATLEARFGVDARLRDPADCEQADVVALLDVIEHLADPADLLDPVVASMRPGALIVVTVPAVQALWSRWDEDLGHHRRYRKRSLRADVVRPSLDVVELGYLFPELLPPALVRRLLGSGSSSASTGAEFPELPRWLDRVLWHIGRCTYRGRRIWPAGTSAVLVARKR